MAGRRAPPRRILLGVLMRSGPALLRTVFLSVLHHTSLKNSSFAQFSKTSHYIQWPMFFFIAHWQCFQDSFFHYNNASQQKVVKGKIHHFSCGFPENVYGVKWSSEFLSLCYIDRENWVFLVVLLTQPLFQCTRMHCITKRQYLLDLQGCYPSLGTFFIFNMAYFSIISFFVFFLTLFIMNLSKPKLQGALQADN